MTDFGTNPESLPIYDMLMEKVTQESGVDQDQIEDLMSTIAYHETGKTMDPSQKQISQHWGKDEGWSNLYPESERFYEGPGRGLYQYELDAFGGQGGGRTAMNRLLNAVKKFGTQDDLPKWAEKYFYRNKWGGLEANDIPVDFSELTAERQSILFLADKLMEHSKPGKKQYENLKKIGRISDAEWWAKYHHKGGGDIEKFSADKRSYLVNRWLGSLKK